MSLSFQNNFEKVLNWDPPSHQLKIRTIDAHTVIEPLRIILEVLPEIKGIIIYEYW